MSAKELKMPPLVTIPHMHIGELASKYTPRSLIDLGGRGRMKLFVKCKVLDANIDRKPRIDATNLPFGDNHFDISTSVNVFEHVSNQAKFLLESKRVAKYATIHFFLLGEPARITELHKKRLGHSHKHTMPSEKIVNDFLRTAGFKNKQLYPLMTIKEHLLLLASIPRYSYMHKKATYKFIDKHGDEPYGYILVGEK